MKLQKVFLIALMCVCMIVSLQAQSGNAKIMGKILEKVDGSAIPGVVVTATSPKLVGAATAISDETGVYRLLNLSPGVYELKFEVEGFATLIRKEVSLKVEQTLTFNVEMELKKLEESIIITGEAPLIDVKDTAKGMNLSKDVFASLPKGRNFDTLATAIPGVSNEAMSSGLSVDGASGAENVFFIDGVDVTSITEGTSAQGTSFDFVEEVQVKASGYQAEFGGSLGGVVNVITRSGGNEFHGEVIGYYSGSALTGKERDRLDLNWADTDIATYYSYEDMYGDRNWSRIEGGLNLGGYLLKDKVWFFGSFMPVLNTTKNDVDYYNSTVSKTLTTTGTNWNYMGKLTAKLSKNIRWSASMVNNFYKRRGASTASGIYSFNNAWGPRGNSSYDYDADGYDWPNYSANTTFDVTLGNNAIVNMRVGYHFTNQNNQQVFADEPCYQFLTEAPGGYFNTTNDKVEWPEIPDSLKRPAGWMNYSRGNAFTLNQNITEKLTVNGDFTYYLNLGGEHAWKLGVQFVRQGQDVDNVANNPVIFLAWGRDNIRYGENYGSGKYGYYGVRGNDLTGPYGDNYNAFSNRWAMYLQDSWTINGRMTINVGVRTESEYIPSYNKEFDVKPIEFGFDQKIAPRIGLVYDVFGDSSLKLFASYGLFYDVMKLDMAVGSYGGFKWKSTYYTLDTYEWDTIGKDGKFPGTNLGTVDFRVPSFDTTDPDLQPMSQQAISFGAEKKISDQLSFTARIVQKHLRYAIEDVGVLQEDGEHYYTTNPGYGWSRLIKNGGKFDNAFPETPKAKREYWAVNLGLDKRFSDRWMGGLSYTWSSLKGNYAGLATTDEPGRNDPNVARYFDLWYLAFDKELNPIDGPLATDRTHVVKVYGSYVLPFGLTVGTVINAMSGTPVTEEWGMDAQGYFPYDRGSMGRTPFLWFANAYLEYSIKMGKNTLKLSANVDNLFDVKTAQRIHQIKNMGALSVSNEDLLAKSWNYDEMDPVEDPRFEKEFAFYDPITVRLGLNFMF
jgi:hypothetical protein